MQDIKKINDKDFLFIKTDVSDETFITNYFDLFIKCFGQRNGLDRDWYEWFNLNCPFGKNNIYVIIDAQTDKMVAAYGLLPFQIVNNNIEYKASLCTNVMVHPDYRGFGLFVEIGEYALNQEKENGSEITLGIPNENAIKGHLKVGWKQFPNIYFYQKDITENFNFVSNTHIKQVNNFDASLELDFLFTKYSHYIKKTKDFLQWRFVDRPHKKYSIFIFEEDNIVKGYIVLKMFQETTYDKVITKTHILDFGYDNLFHFQSLMESAIYFSQINHSDFINLWVVSDISLETEILLKLNFFKTEQYNYLIYYSDVLSSETNFSDWHIVLGDNDVY